MCAEILCCFALSVVYVVGGGGGGVVVVLVNRSLFSPFIRAVHIAPSSSDMLRTEGGGAQHTDDDGDHGTQTLRYGDTRN